MIAEVVMIDETHSPRGQHLHEIDVLSFDKNEMKGPVEKPVNTVCRVGDHTPLVSSLVPPEPVVNNPTLNCYFSVEQSARLVRRDELLWEICINCHSLK